MKKLITLVLAVCLLCGCAIAESAINTIAGRNQAMGYPVVDTPVDVTILVVPKDAVIDFSAETNWMCQYMSRYSGLNINWQVVDYISARERIPLLLNSGDMPDCVLGYLFSTSSVTKYGMLDGLFRPINDLLEYCPNFSKLLEERPEVRKAITSTDGNIYGLPGLSNKWSTANRIFIRESWLNEVGMSNPTTLDEFKDVLIAFRDADIKGDGTEIIPWDGSWKELYSERNVILNAFGYVTGNLAVDYNAETPVITYVPYAENYKDYLVYMNELWNEKLISPDMFTQSESQVQADVLEGKVGVCTQASPVVYDPENEADWRVLNPLVAEGRNRPLYPAPFPIYGGSIAMMVISADISDEKAIALAKLGDVMYTLEWYSMAKHGPEYGSEMDWNNYGHLLNEEGKLSHVVPESMPTGWAHVCTNLTIYSLPGYNLEGYDPYMIEYAEKYPDTAYGEFYKDGPTKENWNLEIDQVCSPYYAEGMPEMFYTEDDLNRLIELSSPLNDYVASMEAKFITGEISIDNDFDAFIDTLESYGVNELIEILNKYYDIYKAG